jgi:hypothetical protein
MRHQNTMPPTGIWIGWATIVVATYVLRSATLAMLYRLREQHTVLWSALNLPEPESQRAPRRAAGVDWHVQRFIWSKGPAETGDAILNRSVRIMRAATILIPVGFLIFFAYIPRP